VCVAADERMSAECGMLRLQSRLEMLLVHGARHVRWRFLFKYGRWYSFFVMSNESARVDDPDARRFLESARIY
jgi:hypothetical protein